MSKFDALLNAVKKAKEGGKTDRDDQYFYYPARDSAGNGSAVIRFLPGATDDEIPFVKLFTHGFKNPANNKWFIDNCPTTIGKECPVCAANSERYATMSKDDARKAGMNRKTSYISRILVVEDKKNPENEGKVFLFKFGSKVFDKIADALQPEFEDTKAINVFDMKEGANFKLRIRIYEGNTNYDKSEFETPSACKAKIEYNEENEIQKFVSDDKFKSTEDLQKRLDFVMGKTSSPTNRKSEEGEGEDEPRDVASSRGSSRSVVTKNDSDDSDDILAMMRKLTEGEVGDDDIPF